MPQETLMIIVVATIAALLIGFLIGKSMGESNASETSAAQEELKQYKASVSEHFGKTADLVDNLTSSYKDVFEHLGISAKELLDEDDVKKHIESRAEKTVVLTYNAEKEPEPSKPDTLEEKVKEDSQIEPQEKAEVPHQEAQENTQGEEKEAENNADVENKVNKA